MPFQSALGTIFNTMYTFESGQIYFFLKELFLDITSELREFEEVHTEEPFAKDGTLSLESSVTIVMASCSCALAIDLVTTCNKGKSSVIHTTRFLP